MDAQSGTQLDAEVVQGFHRIHAQGLVAEIMQKFYTPTDIEEDPLNIRL